MNLKEDKLNEIYKLNREIEKIELKKEQLEEKILELKRKVKNNERKLSAMQRSDSWRLRNKKLIEYGALLEISELTKIENKSMLLGYFLKFHLLTEEEKDNCTVKGVLEFRKREEKKMKLKKVME